MEKVVVNTEGAFLEITEETKKLTSLEQLKAEKETLEKAVLQAQARAIELAERLTKVNGRIVTLEPEVIKFVTEHTAKE